MQHKLTNEQENIINYIKNRPENLLIKAFAGCGKTFIIVEGCKYLPNDKQITFLAFNKHIQEELKRKLPEHVHCYTTYGLGNAAIKRKYKDKIIFDEFKIDKIINKKLKTWDLDDEFSTEEEKAFYLSSIKKVVNLCRLTLTTKPEYILNLIEKHEITNIKKDIDIKRILKVLDTATNDRTMYDYTDMVYLPAIDNSIWMFPQDYVLVDEIQDFGMAQFKIIQKILKKDKVTNKVTGRLIAVGDPFQNIYSFNGSSNSFKWFEEYPNIKTLPLSYSFRCSKKVIEHAQKLVPDIKALDTAIDGDVRKGNVLLEAKDGDFILCRKTMPLIKLFFQFLMNNKKAMVKGSDIGYNLIDLIGEFKDINKLSNYCNNELINFQNDLYNKGILNHNEHSGYVELEDKVSVLLFLSKLSKNIEDLKNKIKAIFSDELKGIVLSTVHKAKGLEANNVFIIRPDILPLKNVRNGMQMKEEYNIDYVARTRAKNELIYDYDWTDVENQQI